MQKWFIAIFLAFLLSFSSITQGKNIRLIVLSFLQLVNFGVYVYRTSSNLLNVISPITQSSALKLTLLTMSTDIETDVPVSVLIMFLIMDN